MLQAEHLGTTKRRSRDGNWKLETKKKKKKNKREENKKLRIYRLCKEREERGKKM